MKDKEAKLFYITWCPSCNQGWVCLYKDVTTKQLYLECKECMVDWKTPEDANSNKDGKFGLFNNSATYATEDEIKDKHWWKFIKGFLIVKNPVQKT